MAILVLDALSSFVLIHVFETYLTYCLSLLNLIAANFLHISHPSLSLSCSLPVRLSYFPEMRHLYVHLVMSILVWWIWPWHKLTHPISCRERWPLPQNPGLSWKFLMGRCWKTRYKIMESTSFIPEDVTVHMSLLLNLFLCRKSVALRTCKGTTWFSRTK